jgi:uncharacterized protein (TIGR00288 family)
MVDEDGYVHLVGRRRDVILRSGSNVHPGEIEDRLQQHPAVQDVAVVGIRDELLGEAISAAVVAVEGAIVTEEELREWCAETLADYKVPDFVRFLEALPMTGTGKIRRVELVRLLEAEPDPDHAFRAASPARTPAVPRRQSAGGSGGDGRGGFAAQSFRLAANPESESMNIPYIRAPHTEGVSHPVLPSSAPNAALLIDFDNVTMGMRSDLSKELKTLLQSDVIRGKVTVQRAYADWRRYPQYIVPLSEASVDLIFAPAYGSSKKNATDIRMAIDGMELVFTRPEIGTYILLTGDSDFSSLVLKLKEYGKYVIGVGIQESSSDILVQNCDEYYSYTTLSGFRKAGPARR